MREIVTFDAYATLINFELAPTTLKVIEDRMDLDNSASSAETTGSRCVWSR